MDEKFIYAKKFELQISYLNNELLDFPLEMRVKLGKLQFEALTTEVQQDQSSLLEIYAKPATDGILKIDRIKVWRNGDINNGFTIGNFNGSLLNELFLNKDSKLVCKLDTQKVSLGITKTLHFQAYYRGVEMSDVFEFPLRQEEKKPVSADELPVLGISNNLQNNTIRTKEILEFVLKANRPDYPNVKFSELSITVKPSNYLSAIKSSEVIYTEENSPDLFPSKGTINEASNFPSVSLFEWLIPFSYNNAGKTTFVLEYTATISNQFGDLVEEVKRQSTIELTIGSSRTSIFSRFPAGTFDRGVSSNTTTTNNSGASGGGDFRNRGRSSRKDNNTPKFRGSDFPKND